MEDPFTASPPSIRVALGDHQKSCKVSDPAVLKGAH